MWPGQCGPGHGPACGAALQNAGCRALQQAGECKRSLASVRHRAPQKPLDAAANLRYTLVVLLPPDAGQGNPAAGWGAGSHSSVQSNDADKRSAIIFPQREPPPSGRAASGLEGTALLPPQSAGANPRRAGPLQPVEWRCAQFGWNRGVLMLHPVGLPAGWSFSFWDRGG